MHSFSFNFFYLFILLKIYLQLTVNRKKEKKYLAYLKTMLISANSHEKTHIYIYKRTIKNINIS